MRNDTRFEIEWAPEDEVAARVAKTDEDGIEACMQCLSVDYRKTEAAAIKFAEKVARTAYGRLAQVRRQVSELNHDEVGSWTTWETEGEMIEVCAGDTAAS